MYCIDVDTGGTMTDTLVSGDAQPLLIKVESTPHDVTVSFMQSLHAAASALGYTDLSAFLAEVQLIRWTSTLTSNVLAQRKGPKLGLIVSPGHAQDLYATSAVDTAAVIPSLIRPEHITTLAPDADRGTIVATLKQLIDQGIRRVNISFKGAFPDGAREQEVLAVISEQFPDHFLGSVPALAGSEMLMQPDDMSRTFYALINAYVHNALANSLFKAEDQVKVEHHWRGDILVGHLNGGVARIGKTKAVDTIESGPLFGTHASAHVATQSGCARVLAMDIGGTTGKASAIRDGHIEMLPQGHIFGIPVRTSLPVLRSNALGGGSIAQIVAGNVTLGPESMGAAPGPACYGLGGSQATLTDALVVLGLIEPTAFLNGRRVLDVERARTAIATQVATPLAASVEGAAIRIYERAVTMMATLAEETAAEARWDALTGAELFAYGGNGPLFGTAVAEVLGISRVRLFALGTVFSAYGSAISDVLHVYERALASGTASELDSAGEHLLAQARRDLEGEGFAPAQARYTWSVENRDRQRLSLEQPLAEATLALVAAVPEPMLLRLEARFGVGQVSVPERAAEAAGLPARRASPLTDGRGLPVHQHAALHGYTIAGPCVIDGGTFTWFIGAGWRLTVDGRGDALATREAHA